MTGLIGLPYYFFFELFSPLIKIFSFIFIAVAAFYGTINFKWIALLIVSVMLITAIIMSLLPLFSKIGVRSKMLQAVMPYGIKVLKIGCGLSLLEYWLNLPDSFYKIAAQIDGLINFLKRKNEWKEICTKRTEADMKITITILFMMLFVVTSFGQTSDPEYYRAQGYQAKVAGDYQTATENYLKILAIDSNDYDALLALARLYAIQEEYTDAIKLYNNIYKNDSTDVEALNGLGNCYSLLGENQKSIHYFQKALYNLPGKYTIFKPCKSIQLRRKTGRCYSHIYRN